MPRRCWAMSSQRSREGVLRGCVVLLVNGDPALRDLDIGLELGDALGELGHP